MGKEGWREESIRGLIGGGMEEFIWGKSMDKGMEGWMKGLIWGE